VNTEHAARLLLAYVITPLFVPWWVATVAGIRLPWTRRYTPRHADLDATDDLTWRLRWPPTPSRPNGDTP
jgi:hypothetical protein